MALGLLNIGKSGIRTARAALDITAQNIANANNPDYSRRSIEVAEMNAAGGIGRMGDSRLSGSRVEGIGRTKSVFLQTVANATSSDAAGIDAQLQSLRAAEQAVEIPGLYPSIVDFEAALAQLSSDPLNPPMRIQVIESARNIAGIFPLVHKGINLSIAQTQDEATTGVAELNKLSTSLGRINDSLARANSGTVSRSSLLDQRDSILSKMAKISEINVNFDDSGRAEVRLGDISGPVIVQGNQVTTLTMAVAGTGSLSFDVAGSAFTPTSGQLAGYTQAIDRTIAMRTELDGVASNLITTANAAQAAGITPAGGAGAPLFSGTGAADIALALSDPDGFATASAGTGTNSRDIGNLDALRAALANNGPASLMDKLLLGISSEISNRADTQIALNTIAEGAASALANETAIDLDQEAANLVRYQQAFQAAGKIMQTASDIFDTMLGIR